MYGRQSMGLELGDLNLAQILGTSAENALQQFQSSLIGQVAAQPQVQQAVSQQAQSSAAQSLASKILANKNLVVYGGIGIIGLIVFLALRK